MSGPSPHYLDERSATRYPIEVGRWRGDDGAPLTVGGLRGLSASDVDTGTRSLWRYRAALPESTVEPVSLGEGSTPLVEKRWGAGPVLFKLEWFSPTGSFKDRGVSVLISHLAAHGVRQVIEDSSGNGGASVAAYCAAAGMRARIFAPDSTSPAKILQTRAYGAEIELVPGGRDATAERAIAEAAHTTFASHNWHPFFLQGTKTIAYEIWEDLGFAAPDNVVTVAGAGSIVLGCDLGFGELLAAGQIERLPKLLVAQPANCAPIHASFQAGARGLVPVDYAPTIAEGTAIRYPVRLPEVLAAIRRSGGDTAAIPEQHLATAVRGLASLGLYAEPTSAGAAAAIEVFRARGAIQPGQTTVVVLTGSGLKAAARMAELFEG